MCGIAGFSGEFPEDLLPRMSQVIAHRGPDGDGLFYDAATRVGLAHRRLAIIDLSETGAQPMTSPDGRFTLVFNGEIYDTAPLRKTLEASGVSFRGTSDTEVLLHAWCRWGEAALPKLNGIFAFAMWDARERSLTLVRDRMGVKPLYFATDPRGVLFASEIKAILQDPHVDRTLDERAVRDYVLYMYAPWPRTMLRAVRKLPPGGLLVARDGRIVRETRYATLPVPPVDDGWSVGDATARLRAVLQTAVDRQLVADVPVGAFLSGGLDSSAIVALLGKRRIDCYTIAGGTSDRDGFEDDLPFARTVARHLNQPLHEIAVGPDMFREVPRMLWHLDEPEADPAAINVLWICAGARERGVKVLLGGTGGDDLFGGYRRHAALMFERYWAWMPQPLRVALASITQLGPQGIPTFRRLAKAFSHAGRDPLDRMLGYFQWSDEAAIARVFAPDVAKQLSCDRFAESLRPAYESFPTPPPQLQKMLLLEQSHFLTDHNLNYTDKLSMAVGVEVRVPFLDPDVMTFAASLPARFKQHGTVGKWLFKKAMEPMLPRNVIYRPKTGFGAPVRSWVHDSLSEQLDEWLSPESVRKRGLFRWDEIASLRDQDRAGKVDAAYSILSLAFIEVWCRIFVDRTVPDGSW